LCDVCTSVDSSSSSYSLCSAVRSASVLPLQFLQFHDYQRLLTHAVSSREGRFSVAFVCLSVCLFPHDISKTDAARNTKLDTEMFHYESWKPVYFWIERLKVKVTRRQKQCRRGSLHCCECWLLLVNVYVYKRRTCSHHNTALSSSSRLNCAQVRHAVHFCLFVIPAKASEYVFTGVGLCVCVCVFVCLSVTTITKKCGRICTKFYAKVPRGKGN